MEAPAVVSLANPAVDLAPAAPAPLPVQEAAQIVNEPSVETSPAAGSRESTMTAALEEGVKLAPATLQNALDRNPPTTAKPQARSSKSAAAEDKGSARSTATRKAAADNKPVARTAAAPADKDISLLAAVIAHEKNRDSGARTSADTRRPAKQDIVSTSQDTSEKSSRPAATGNRDIVARNAAEPTDSLLKRCSALGFVESQLCRFRICSGQWETDSACKASMSGDASRAPTAGFGDLQTR